MSYSESAVRVMVRAMSELNGRYDLLAVKAEFADRKYLACKRNKEQAEAYLERYSKITEQQEALAVRLLRIKTALTKAQKK